MAVSYRRSFHEDNGFPRRHGGEQCEGARDSRQILIPCQDCDGFSAECATCRGYGFEEIFSCPWCAVEPELGELIVLHATWPGALPCAGGIYDQPAGYVQAMRFLDYGHGLMDREMQEEIERERAKEK